MTMTPTPGREAGFRSRIAATASSRLIHAVVASLAFASLWLSAIVVMTLATAQHSLALPL
ncbi:MAG: hypothetical protein EWM45_16915 [Rhodopseudomonas palustris]|nr:MAG: hypothetical protein EWM45_16915 [Rhodopseudomonas palustris]